MNPYVFIVGCPRSGTTVLERILNSHPEVAIIHETHWIRTFFKARIGMSARGIVQPEMIPALNDHPGFKAMEIPDSSLENLIGLTYAEFVGRVFDLYGAPRSKRFVGDKTPAYVRELVSFHQLWPQVKFIHVIRDGRSVCLSATEWKETNEVSRYPSWLQDPVRTAAYWWEMYVRLGREASSQIDHYCEVRYESLIADPKNECKRICDFLNVTFDQSMLRVQIGSGLRDWKSQMRLADLRRFENASGELLTELGYERRFPGAVDKDALKIRDEVAAFVKGLGLRVPAKWEMENPEPQS